MMSEFIHRSQSVNFLGFLRGQLNGLQGIPTLCYELIQNADDVKDENGNPGASKISFDVRDDALYVYNDGVFREIDFERMMKLSWGDKREEEGTTGAFGLGFISVYQITDSPEIFSSGRHWQFNPNAPEDERIIETKEETKATKFRLPWAFEESEVRVELGIPPIDKDLLNYYTHQIKQSIEDAALFLKQVNVLKVRRNGELVREIATARYGDELIISNGEDDIFFRIYKGCFDDKAKVMRDKHGKVIEKKRKSEVQIAIPDTPGVEGLLYAFLPSEDKTGLPFHINADFYPTPDRKRIIFETGHKKEWNEAAIECAAETLAEHCEDILEIYLNQDFWEFVERVEKASERKQITNRIGLFWEKLKPEIEQRKSVLTSLGTVVYPKAAIFLDIDELVQAGEIYNELKINTLHPDLRSKINVLRKIGVKNLNIANVYDSFIANGLTQRIETKDLPQSLQTDEGWQVFWSAVNKLWDRASQYDRYNIQTDIEAIPIAFGSDGALWPPNQLLQADSKTIVFFSKISSAIWFDEKYETGKIPSSLVQQFKIQDGIDILENSQDDLIELYRHDLFSPLELLEWLEINRHQLSFSHKQAVKELSIWPTGEKQLKPLSDLFLAGDFEDPLQLAQLVNLEALGGRRDFLQEHLKVSKLDFYTYVKDWIPDVVSNHELKVNEKHELIKILAEHRSNLVDDHNLCNVLAQLPIVWCGDEEFYPAGKVWFDTNEVKDVLGCDIHLAKLPDEKQEAVRELYEWLGVSLEPAPKDIVKRIKDVVQDLPNYQNRQLIGRLIRYIASKWPFWDEYDRGQFSGLRNLAWLPGTKERNKWLEPQNVYSIYLKHLFESVGNFLDVDFKVQQSANDFFKFLRIESEPSPDQVVRHLRNSSNKNEPINNEIYVFLNRSFEHPSIRLLFGEKCLFLRDTEGNGTYFTPDQVFWDHHSFGEYRFRLSAEYGRFKNLFDKIGVKESPDVDDAIKVLIELSNKYGTSNISLSEDTDDKDILIMCWKIICEALDNEEISANEVKSKLSGEKTIPDSRNILEKPELMFFEDRPGWSEKFQIVKNNLTPRIEGAWQAMEAAGVRPLSSVITTEMVELGNPIDDSTLAELLEERNYLFRRVIESHRNQGNKGLNINSLNNLTFIKANPIDIVRIFSGFNKKERSQLETVDAILIDDVLYFSAQNGSLPLRGIARELSYVINPTGEICSLGMELNVILSQTVDEAILSLDDWGYPRIEIKDTNIPEGATLAAADDVLPEIEGIRKPVPHPDGEQLGTTSREGPGESEGQEPGTVSGDGSGAKPSVGRKKPKKRKTSRLVSYVYPEDAYTDREEDPRHAKKRSRVANAGVEKVMQVERENGRDPTDMEEIEVHHPGYDVESRSEDGTIRFIEVKSLSGTWDSQNPAQLTKTEFNTAKHKGQAFWLYVVERAESDDYKIFKIQDPANRVDYYLFDHGWDVELSKEE